MAVSEFTRRSGVVSMRGVGDVLKVVEDKAPVEESVAVDNDVVVGVDEEVLAGVVIQVAIREHRGPGADVVLVELEVGFVFALAGDVLDVGPVVPVRGVGAVEARGVLQDINTDAVVRRHIVYSHDRGPASAVAADRVAERLKRTVPRSRFELALHLI